MKYRDHIKEVTRLRESYAAAMRLERSRSAHKLLQYMTDDTLQRVADDLERVQDAGSWSLVQIVAEAQDRRRDRQPWPEGMRPPPPTTS